MTSFAKHHEYSQFQHVEFQSDTAVQAIKEQWESLWNESDECSLHELVDQFAEMSLHYCQNKFPGLFMGDYTRFWNIFSTGLFQAKTHNHEELKLALDRLLARPELREVSEVGN